MKLSSEEIDSFYRESGDCDDYYWDNVGPEPIEYLNKKRKELSLRHDIHEKTIKISWCAPVDEYCIYINGVWSGYLSCYENN